MMHQYDTYDSESVIESGERVVWVKHEGASDIYRVHMVRHAVLGINPDYEPLNLTLAPEGAIILWMALSEQLFGRFDGSRQGKFLPGIFDERGYLTSYGREWAAAMGEMLDFLFERPE